MKSRLIGGLCNARSGLFEFHGATPHSAAPLEMTMFSMIFEARPHSGEWDSFRANAAAFGPALERLPGFIDNGLWRSLTREGWILSLTGLRDEDSVARWLERQDELSGRGRAGLLANHQLRVGEILLDTKVPDGRHSPETRVEKAETGKGAAVTLIDARQPSDWAGSRSAEEIALYLGFDPYSWGDCISWDLFEAVGSPGSNLLLATWKDLPSALAFAQTAMVPDDARVRAARIVREPSQVDRRAGPEEMTTDHDNLLKRFVDAQALVYDDAIDALRARTLDARWMAFIFPRFVNCYHDPTTEMFAIGSLDEARAFLAHPLLGPRMRQSLAALEWLYDLDPEEILSRSGRQELHSSLTLFAEATNEPLMRNMLAHWFGCRADETTIAQLDLRP